MAKSSRNGRPKGSLQLHDGAAEDGGMTLADIGRALGVSREAVRQTEARALNKVRALLSERGIGAEDVLDDSPATASSMLGAMRSSGARRRAD